MGTINYKTNKYITLALRTDFLYEDSEDIENFEEQCNDIVDLIYEETRFMIKQYNFEYKNTHWMRRFVTELSHNIRWVFFRFAFVAVCFI